MSNELEDKQYVGNQLEWRLQVTNGQTEMSFGDWLDTHMTAYDVTVDRTAVRSHRFRVNATNPDDAEELAHELARHHDFSTSCEENGVEYNVLECREVEDG